ncbi:Uncharacterized protein TCM_047013 [Theobroma cacao]|uniref:Uncharacterized protein n=1 Tax=Theobroma cacao TaxID=3641 RepID=A0A061G125_THECC|nr:Uncharacterized protein TCM_047013 [Theobroma cacao]
MRLMSKKKSTEAHKRKTFNPVLEFKNDKVAHFSFLSLFVRQGANYWVKMGCVFIAWSFLGFHLVQQFTSQAQERFTPSNMISQMCSASCQACSWLLERLFDSSIWCMAWRNFCRIPLFLVYKSDLGKSSGESFSSCRPIFSKRIDVILPAETSTEEDCIKMEEKQKYLCIYFSLRQNRCNLIKYARDFKIEA